MAHVCARAVCRDPFLTGEYVMQFSYHMQHGPDPKYLRVLSTAKHFLDYDQEGSPVGVMRGDFDAIVSDQVRHARIANTAHVGKTSVLHGLSQDQVEYYLPAWRAAIKGGDIRGFMCSYNNVNGVPAVSVSLTRR